MSVGNICHSIEILIWLNCNSLNKKVSIVVCCYNQGKYLSEAIESILLQTYKEWECIIINDGSSDDTEKISLVYENRDRRIHYIYQDNQGVCKARNNAIDAAQGEYILCLDADDKISNNYLELAVKELDDDLDVTVVACDYQYFGRDFRIKKLEPYSIEKLMGHNLFVNCSMFRKSDFIRVNGFNENMVAGLEDWDFWLSVLEDGGKVKYLNGVHFYYRIKPMKYSRNYSTKKRENFIKLREQMWRNHKELYSNVYSTPYYSEEYRQIANSIEYKIGKKVFAIFSFLISILKIR